MFDDVIAGGEDDVTLAALLQPFIISAAAASVVINNTIIVLRFIMAIVQPVLQILLPGYPVFVAVAWQAVVRLK